MSACYACGQPKKQRRWHVSGEQLIAQEAVSKLSWDTCEEFFRLRDELLVNGWMSLIMFGWATDEIIRVRHDYSRETLRVDGEDVYEVSFKLPGFVGHGVEKYEIIIRGRWISWPYKY